MRKTFHYIYKTTCKETDKFYIGKHTTHSLENDYLGSGALLKNSIKKYGIDKHVKEILLFASSIEELNALEETEIAKHLGKNPKCMNIKPGGGGGWYEVSKLASSRGTLFTRGMLGKKHSSKAKRRMSLSKIGKNNNQFGKRAYVNPDSGERRLLFEKPENWITPLEYQDTKKKKNHSTYGKKWYNDGKNNFLLNTTDERIKDLCPGRINPGFGKRRKPA